MTIMRHARLRDRSGYSEMRCAEHWPLVGQRLGMILGALLGFGALLTACGQFVDESFAPSGRRAAHADAMPSVVRAKDHARLLDRARAAGRIAVIIRLRIEMAPESALGPREIQSQRARLAGIQQQVLDRLGHTPDDGERARGVKRFTLVPALALQADVSDLEKLFADPFVLDVSEDLTLPPT